jgi:lipopolysaccharide transport system permease protein
MSTTVPTVLRIEPRKGWVALRLGELWQYRELLYFLTWRDIKVRYRQTVLGVLWAIMVPLVSMVLFTVVFARMANVASDNRPYPVFNLAALLPWNFFAAALAMCANSVAQTSHLMSKVYFPRLIAPLSAVLGGIPDFLIAFGLLLVVMAWYRIRPTCFPGPPSCCCRFSCCSRSRPRLARVSGSPASAPSTAMSNTRSRFSSRPGCS